MAATKLSSQFTIVATVDDQRVGESTFTAEQLESTLRDALNFLHLKVVQISVVRPASMPAIPGSHTRASFGVKPLPVVGDEVTK